VLKIGSHENTFKNTLLEVSVSKKVLRLLPKIVFLGAVMGIAAGTGFLAGQHWKPQINSKNPEQLVQLPDHATPLKPGPWGNLESLPICIEPPEEYLSIQNYENADRRWRFPGMLPDQVSAVFTGDDLTAEQQAQLLDRSKWRQDNGEIIVAPSNELVLSLSQHARKRIYGVLSGTLQNLVRSLRCSFPADRFDAIFAESGLSSETIALVKKLSFPHGRLVLFCDIPLALDMLSDYEEKVRLVKTMTRRETLLLKLHIMPDSDINALAAYWSKASWGKDVKPMLESLGKVPGGARLGLVHLLPRIPADSLYTYPFPSTKPEDLHKDCHWAAFNFFRDTPDNRFTAPAVVEQTIQNDYYPVISDPRYGDIVMLATEKGAIIHSSVYIADNIVYTKNSGEYINPFLLMTIPDMIDTFEAFIPENEHLKVLVYRSKYY